MSATAWATVSERAGVPPAVRGQRRIVGSTLSPASPSSDQPFPNYDDQVFSKAHKLTSIISASKLTNLPGKQLKTTHE